MESKELGIYIHIPFCKSKCYYCDFISYSNLDNKIENYIEQIICEIKQYSFQEYNITTIYMGGGTPSYIDEKYIKQLLEVLQKELVGNQTKWEDIEITIEVNPGTITKAKLETYRKNGINRISIGLQSTNDKLLKELGRIHTFKEFLEAYQLVQKADFKNSNIDFMIGLPNQTIEDIKQTLDTIQKLNPNHVSMYSLIVEEETKIEQLISARKTTITRRRKRTTDVLVCKKQIRITWLSAL